ncbi:MAG: chemotaxis protein, partial [Cyanobacteria bacterium SW_6_48_11]
MATIFNQLADNIVNSETALAAEARQTQLLTEIALVRHSQELESSLNQFLAEVRATLKADRVVLYKFDENWQGTVPAESVTGGWPKALGVQIADPCFAEK